MAQSPETRPAVSPAVPVENPLSRTGSSPQALPGRIDHAGAADPPGNRNAPTHGAGAGAASPGAADGLGGAPSLAGPRAPSQEGPRASMHDASRGDPCTPTRDDQRTLIGEMAERLDQMMQQMSWAVRQGAAGLHSVMVPPPGAAETVRDMQDGLASMVNDMVQSNIRMTQHWLHLADPDAVLALQRRFIRDHIDVLLQSGSTLVRLTRRSTDHALHPIQQRIDRWRQNGHGHHPVSDVMRADVHLVTPDDTVQQATRLMRDDDTGVVAVGDGDRLVGMVTDRDVSLRVVAEGRDPQRTKVRDVMTTEAHYVFDDEDADRVAEAMAAQHLRRLPVVDRNRRVVGTLALSDLAPGDGADLFPTSAGPGPIRSDGAARLRPAAE